VNGPTNRIKVLIRDPENLQLEALMLALDRNMSYEVIEDGGEGESVLAVVRRRRVDVVVAAMDAPGPSALTTASELANATPPVPLVVVIDPAERHHVRPALLAGVKGCVAKGANAVDLYVALPAAVRGEVFVSAELGGIPEGW
jgi:DNA-binding NarL/FixJ family response regulator